MKGFRAVYVKELREIFGTPIALVTVAVFWALSGYLFSFNLFFSSTGQMVTSFHNMTLLLMLVMPLVSMRLFAEENKTGTLELLLTMPISDGALVAAKYAAGLTVLGLIGFVVGLLVLAGQQIVLGFAQLSDSVVTGTRQLLDRLEDTPWNVGTDTVNDWINDFGASIQDNSAAILGGALTFGSTAGLVLTGLVITVFTLVFFLIDGERIWLFLVRLFPVHVRRAVNGAGRHGWTSLVHYARAQGVVAAIDAVGIGVGAVLLGVPLALPIGILVLLGSFIPIVGAVATGAVAVLVALVTNGVTNALLMLAVVLFVQQLEGNVLQPLIMGKAVSLHPLAVFLAVACGAILYGITGALFAVPILAFFNTVMRYFMGRHWVVDDEVDWEPYYFPWEIKRHARKNHLSREQVLAQLERFRRTRAKERQLAHAARQDNPAQATAQGSERGSSAHR